jgi:hypothetical protein
MKAGEVVKGRRGRKQIILQRSVVRAWCSLIPSGQQCQSLLAKYNPAARECSNLLEIVAKKKPISLKKKLKLKLI